MEPYGLNELKSYLYKKYCDSDTKITQEYLQQLSAVDIATRDVDDLATIYSSYYASEFNERKSYVLNTYTEEIEDKDLGIVRKINLN